MIPAFLTFLPLPSTKGHTMAKCNPLFKIVSLALSALLTCTSPSLQACTRVLFTGTDNTVITARSLDWEEDMHSDLWVFPRGLKQNGAAGARSIEWTSKYGSVIVSGYNVGTADGMNEKGLVANALYLAESDYGKLAENKKPLLSISLWAQYALDNFETVASAVEALSKEPFFIIAPVLPNGSPAQLHLSLSDPNGDSAIFEYIDGKLVVHHGKQFTVMTNSPSFDKQLALNTYWEEIGGQSFLPGTSRAADRFARAAFLLSSIPKEPAAAFISAVPEHNFMNQALASMLGVIRSVSVPLGISTPGKPNIASTFWRTLSDHKTQVYYFDSAASPNICWVDLNELDFNKGAPVKTLKVSNGSIYLGNVTNQFKPAQIFKFLPAKQ